MSFVFVLAFVFQALYAECNYKIGAHSIWQEQPFVACGPRVRPEREKKRSVKEDDRTNDYQNARFMRRDRSL